MIEGVRLAGGTWPWLRPGFAPVATWLSAVADGQGPGPQVLPLGDDPEGGCLRIEAELRRACFAPERARLSVWPLPTLPAEPAAAARAFLRAWLGLEGAGDAPAGPGADPAALLAEAAGEGVQLALVAVPAPAAEHLEGARQAAAAALAAVRQRWPEAPVGVGLQITGPAPGDPLRLDRAWPVATPPGQDDGWLRYVHLRLGWHAAGELSRLPQDLAAPRDDLALSATLDGLATRWLDGLPARAAVEAAGADDLPVVLAEHGLLLDQSAGWAGPPLPSPWLARALLARQPAHPARRQLRAAEACRPWIRELLDRCLWLEALLRDRLDPPRGEIFGGQLIFDRFESGKGAEHGLIIDIKPHNPMEPIDFFSLGEVSWGQKPALEGCLKDLSRLRNVLAHGHAVGWAAHEALERLEAAAVRLA